MRRRHFFWLDDNKPTEAVLINDIGKLKENRQYTRFIRDGIRLMIDLSQGKTDVLRELFPWVLEEQKEADLPEHFYEGMESFWGKLETVEKLLMNPPVMETTTVSVQKTKRLPAKTDDDLLGDLEIKQAKSDENPTWNMLISSIGLGTAKLEDLPPACIEYGVKKGKLAESAMKFVKQKPVSDTERKGPQAMDVPQFEEPDFDDLELDF